MATKKIRYDTVINNNNFINTIVPEYEIFKISLEASEKRKMKGEDLLSVDYDYVLKIHSDIPYLYKRMLDEQLSVAFSLSWTPYNKQTKEYSYFTTKYNTNIEKEERLKNIFQVLKDFEIYYKEAIKESEQSFNIDSVERKTYNDHEVIVKYNKDKNCFLVVAKRFLGSDKYPILRNAAHAFGTLSKTEYKESGFLDEFIDWKKQKRDLSYFEISPETYFTISNFIELKEEIREIFQENQLDILEKIGKEKLAFFDEENIFNLKVVYDEKLKMFEFFCVGYSEPKSYEGILGKRNTLGFLAVNYILSKDIDSQECNDNFNLLEDNTTLKNEWVADIDINCHNTGFKKKSRYKYNLIFEEESDKKQKKMYLSLEYNDILKDIINNYENKKSFFGRKVKIIKIEDAENICKSVSVNSKYPFIYFHNDGKCFYVLKTRQTNSFTMHSLETTHEEALFYLNEHPWKKEIKQNSVHINTEIWFTSNNQPQMNYEDREISFEKLLLHNKMQVNLKKESTEKIKKNKI